METRTCRTCGKEHPLQDYKRVGPAPTRMWNCRECYTANRRHNRQTGWPVIDLQRYVRYGVTPDEYAEAFAEANGVCQLCSQEKSLVIDHCHESNQYRGLICRECNLMLGHAKDNIETLQKAITYLNRNAGLSGASDPESSGRLNADPPRIREAR